MDNILNSITQANVLGILTEHSAELTEQVSKSYLPPNGHRQDHHNTNLRESMDISSSPPLLMTKDIPILVNTVTNSVTPPPVLPQLGARMRK